MSPVIIGNPNNGLSLYNNLVISRSQNASYSFTHEFTLYKIHQKNSLYNVCDNFFI